MRERASVELTVVDWNVNGFHTIRDEQLDLLASADADVLLLQEVTAGSVRRLRSYGWHGSTALDVLPNDHTERNGVRPTFSSGVLARSEIGVVNPATVADAPSSVRMLAAELLVEDRMVLAISAALPPGRQWGRQAKVAQAHALGRKLARVDAPVVLGIDRNGPQFERWEPASTVWWPEDDPNFFSPKAEHGLSDALTVFFDEHPAAAEDARTKRPEGPLAVSYVEKQAMPTVSRRYDLIMVSEHWTVLDVDYDYCSAEEAGSDHALVRAAIRL